MLFLNGLSTAPANAYLRSMQRTFLRLLLLFAGCATAQPSVSIDTLLTGKFSVRAIVPTSGGIWFGADKGRYGFVSFEDAAASFIRQADTVTSEFRSIARRDKALFLLNAGSPATLYRVPLSGPPECTYTETGPAVFYDSMQFFDDRNGIAMGDPISGCLSVIMTSDGGTQWTKIPCTSLPPVAEGEAAFAASNTNLILREGIAWMVSGGKNARVFRSDDKGRIWNAYETPIVRGSPMTGIFTADFYNGEIGIIAGGDYEKPQDNHGNKAVTSDGGRTWMLVGEGQGPGYISCIQFIPGSKGKGLLTVGATGIHLSDDGGRSWTRLSEDKALFTLRFASPKVAYAAGKGKIIRLSLP